jgi:zinc/manganese transport system permease protein
VWAGLVIAVMFNLPPSFCIVTLAFLAWITTLAVTRRWRPARSHSDIHDRGHPAHDRHHPESAELSI